MYVQVCKCAANSEQFLKHYFNHRDDSMMMAPMECRNMQEENLCVCYVYIPVHVSCFSKIFGLQKFRYFSKRGDKLKLI